MSTSVSDITGNAGVSKGLLYNYYENKDALIKELILSGMKRMTMDFDFDYGEKLTKERFEQLINKYFELLENDTEYWKLYLSIITQPAVTDLVKEEIIKMLSPFLKAVSQYYKDKNEKSPEAGAWLIGAILDGVSLDYMFDRKHYPVQEIKEIIIKKLL
jgi:AcrR family transcriptional regulator